MPDFDKPALPYNYQPQARINALRAWEQSEPGRALAMASVAAVAAASHLAHFLAHLRHGPGGTRVCST